MDPFISRTDLQNYTGRDMSADDGALICVDAACEMVRTEAGQFFNPVTADTIVLDGTGTDALLLPQRPVTAVGTVVVGTTVAGTSDYVLADNGALIATSGTVWWCEGGWGAGWAPLGPYGWGPWAGGAVWPRGRQNITVTYDHGYTDGTAPAVPADVRMVALALAARMVEQGNAKSESLGDQSVTYAVNSTDFGTGERAILRKYKTAR